MNGASPKVRKRDKDTYMSDGTCWLDRLDKDIGEIWINVDAG